MTPSRRWIEMYYSLHPIRTTYRLLLSHPLIGAPWICLLNFIDFGHVQSCLDALLRSRISSFIRHLTYQLSRRWNVCPKFQEGYVEHTIFPVLCKISVLIPQNLDRQLGACYIVPSLSKMIFFCNELRKKGITDCKRLRQWKHCQFLQHAVEATRTRVLKVKLEFILTFLAINWINLNPNIEIECAGLSNHFEHLTFYTWRL